MTRIMLAGSDGLPGQDHQRDMWMPAALRAGLAVTAFWVHPEADDDEVRRAAHVAAALGIELARDPQPPTADVDAIICCQRGDRRRLVLSAAQAAGVPVLLDKPTLDSTTALDALAAALPGASVLAGHHFSAHPSFTRMLRAVHTGELGLLRAVHAELVVARGDGPSPDGELRNLLVYLVDLARRLAGGGSLRLSADRVDAARGGSESWSVLAQTDRQVVVGLHLTRTVSGSPEILTGRVRVNGTHGSAVVDLTSPAVEVRTAGERTLESIGPDSVTMLVAALADADAAGAIETRLDELAVLSRFLDDVEAAAADGAVRETQW